MLVLRQISLATKALVAVTVSADVFFFLFLFDPLV